jgi:hypothetical protein
MDQRDLVGAAAFDMAVERVVAGIDDTTAEPATVDALRGIEDLFRRLDPVDFLGRLGPKALRVGQRARLNLVIEALSVDVPSDVHSRAPVPFIRLGLTLWQDKRPAMTGIKYQPCLRGIFPGTGRGSS